MTPTFRRDRLTGIWRLVAPTRAGVPLPANRAEDPGLPSNEGRCPFCPGHEEDAGSTVARLPDDGPWVVRVVRNKFPAVAEPSPTEDAGDPNDAREADSFDADSFDADSFDADSFDAGSYDGGSYDAGSFDAGSLDAGSFDADSFDEDLGDDRTRATPSEDAFDDERPTRLALGAHEVVVESRAHDGDLHELSLDHLALVLRSYRDRVACHEGKGAACVLLFRNRGVRAGSTQAHPHAQVVASSVVPTEIALRAERARAHHARTGERAIDAERAEAERANRVVLRDAFGTLLCPHAPAGPYETWLVPHRAAPFARLEDGELDAFASLLRRGLTLTLAASGRRAWNLLFHLPPRAHRDAPHAFWFASILPRSGPGAGLELVSGTTVVTVAPEDAAARLRALADNAAPSPH